MDPFLVALAVLASCETAADVREADRRNYATCITVPEFEAEAAYTKDGVRIIPCPNQTRGVACTDCRLCFNDDRLQLTGLTIGFAVHGAGKNKAKAALARIPLVTL